MPCLQTSKLALEMGIGQKRSVGGEEIVFDTKYYGQVMPLDI